MWGEPCFVGWHNGLLIMQMLTEREHKQSKATVEHCSSHEYLMMYPPYHHPSASSTPTPWKYAINPSSHEERLPAEWTGAPLTAFSAATYTYRNVSTPRATQPSGETLWGWREEPSQYAPPYPGLSSRQWGSRPVFEKRNGPRLDPQTLQLIHQASPLTPQVHCATGERNGVSALKPKCMVNSRISHDLLCNFLYLVFASSAKACARG